MKKLALFLGVAVLLALPVLAMADSIIPASFSATLGVGDSTTVTKTVTVTEGATTSKVDVFFLADSTGSMGSQIGAVKAAASSILASAAGLGDVAFAAGEYRDIYDAFTYRLNQDITTSQAAAQAGINAWFAGGGGDYPEAGMFALKQVADTTSWRDGSERILVWFGDAPGHDPRGGVTEAAATAALVGNGIQVEAINVSPSTWDSYPPYGAGFAGLNDTAQASRITAATGGVFLDGINASTIVAAINDAISTAVATYSTVSLDVSGVPSGVGVGFTPGAYTGMYDRSTTRTFDFSLTFTGITPGDYSFSVYGLVDGGRVATESDRIIVGGGGTGTVPEPGTLLLLGAGLSLIGLLGRKKVHP